jgi:hypothetical protein
MELRTLEDFEAHYGSRAFTKKDLIYHLFSMNEKARKAEEAGIGMSARIKELEERLDEEEGRHAVEMLDAEYEGWKKANAGHMERFVKELLRDSLSLRCSDDEWAGHFTVELRLDGSPISSADGHITVGYNPYDE